MLVAANKELYVTLPKKQKLMLSMSIVNAVRSQTPPGRFLQKDAKTGLYYDVGDQRAQEKTSQALREGAPDIKKKITNPLDSVPPLKPPPLPVPPPLPPQYPTVPAALPLPVSVPVALPPPVSAQGPVPSRTKKKSSTTTQSQDARSSIESDSDFRHSATVDGQHYSRQQLFAQQCQNVHGSTSATSGPLQSRQYDDIEPRHLPPPVDGGLEPSALSFGTYMSMGTIDASLNASDHYYNDFRDPSENGVAEPVDGGLDSTQGVSFGTAVMSVDSLQLERAGLSIGSIMSLATMPAAVDGGLEAIGTSFGSMSIATRDATPGAVDGGLFSIGMSMGSLSLTAEDRALLINSLREDNIEIPAILESTPTFLSAQRSKANLLECSDTDSDEESRKASSAHPSADWEKLRATLAAQTAAMPSSSVVPPPFFPGARTNPSVPNQNNFMFPSGNGEFYVPTTGFDRDLSALSVGDFEPSYLMSPSTDERDRRAMPPPANRYANHAITELSLPQTLPSPSVPSKKEQNDQWVDVEQLEAAFLARGNSLTGEFEKGK